MLRGIITTCLGIFIASMCLFSCAGILANVYMPLDFFNHLRLQYAISLLLALCLCLCLRLGRLTIVCVVLIALNIVPILRLYLEPRLEPVAGAKQLKILDMNLLYSVTDYGPAMARIRAVDPDILVFQELSPNAVTAMKEILKTYPYGNALPVGNPSGHGIYSRIRLSEITESPSFLNLFTVQHVKFQLQGRQIALVNLHTYPPLSEKSILANMSVLQYLKGLRQSGEEMILIGDYNAAPWSYYFNLLTDGLKLSDTEAGLGPQFSWPAGVPAFFMPIDHCCVSQGIGLSQRKLLAKTESDHLPLYVELALSGK